MKKTLLLIFHLLSLLLLTGVRGLLLYSFHNDLLPDLFTLSHESRHWKVRRLHNLSSVFGPYKHYDLSYILCEPTHCGSFLSARHSKTCTAFQLEPDFTDLIMDSLDEEWQRTIRKLQACTANTSYGPGTTKLLQTVQSRMNGCEPSLATFRESEGLRSGSPLVGVGDIAQALETFVDLHVFIEGIYLALGHALPGHGASSRSVEHRINAACKKLHELLSRVIAQGAELLNALLPAIEINKINYETQWLRARDGKKAALHALRRLEERESIDAGQALLGIPKSNRLQPQSQTLVAGDTRAHPVGTRRSRTGGTSTAAAAQLAGVISRPTKRRYGEYLDVQSPREDSVGIDMTKCRVGDDEQRGSESQSGQLQEISRTNGRLSKKPRRKDQELLDHVNGQGMYPRRRTTPKIREISRSPRSRRVLLRPR